MTFIKAELIRLQSKYLVCHKEESWWVGNIVERFVEDNAPIRKKTIYSGPHCYAEDVKLVKHTGWGSSELKLLTWDNHQSS